MSGGCEVVYGVVVCRMGVVGVVVFSGVGVVFGGSVGAFVRASVEGSGIAWVQFAGGGVGGAGGEELGEVVSGGASGRVAGVPFIQLDLDCRNLLSVCSHPDGVEGVVL